MINQLIKSAKLHGIISADVEYENRHYHEDFKLLGCSFATKDLSCYVKDHTQIQEMLYFLKEVKVAGHFFQTDICALISAGFNIPILNIHDTSLMYDDDLLSLRELAKVHLGKMRLTHQQAWSFGPESKEFEQYAKFDSEDTLSLFKEIDTEEYHDKRKCIQKIGEITQRGMSIDYDILCEQGDRLETIERELNDHISYQLGGSVNSAKFQKYIDRLGLPKRDYDLTASGKICNSIKNLKKISKLDELTEFAYFSKKLKSYKNRYLMKFLEFYMNHGKYYGTINLCDNFRLNPTLMQKIPYNIGHDATNTELKNALSQLNFNAIFPHSVEKIDGVKELPSQNGDVINFFKKTIWVKK